MSNNYDEAFSCFQCKEIPEVPYESECCGKLYCQSCWEVCTYLNCKLCKALLRFRVSVFAKSILNQFETNCKYGCGLKIKYAQSRQHYFSCESKEYECNIKTCLFKGNLSQIKQHIQTVHIYEIMVLNENYNDIKPILTRCCPSLENLVAKNTKVKATQEIYYQNNNDRPLNNREVAKAVSPKFSMLDYCAPRSYPYNDNYEFDREYGDGEGEETQPLQAKSFTSSSSLIITEDTIRSESNAHLTNEFTERLNKINKDLAETIDCLQKPAAIRLANGINGDIIPTMPDQTGSELESHSKVHYANKEIPEEAKYSEDLKELEFLPFRI